MATLLVWANVLNRSVPAFGEAQKLLEAEDSPVGRVIRSAKTRKTSDITPEIKFSRSSALKVAFIGRLENRGASWKGRNDASQKPTLLLRV
jgi:hypothetical protein